MVVLIVSFWLTFGFAFGNEMDHEPMPATTELTFMLGEWVGEGWILGRAKQRKHFSQSEIINSKHDMQALVVEGLGHALDSSGRMTDRVIHKAFGLISYNDVRGTVTMISFSEKTGRVESDMFLVGEKTLQWSFDDISGATIRFTEDFSTEGTWVEVGEISMNGSDWYKFFEMNLKREPTIIGE